MNEGGLDSDSGFEGMMAQFVQGLLKKDILAEPIEIISQKFPEWLERNKETLSGDEIEQYERQQACIQEINVIISASEDPDMVVVLEKFNEMMDICSFPDELLEEVFGNMGLDMSDLNSLSQSMGG